MNRRLCMRRRLWHKWQTVFGDFHKLSLLIVLLLGCSKEPSPSGGAAGASGKAPTKQATERVVEVALAERADFTRTLRLGGSLTARQSVQVASRVEGVVTNVVVDLGDEVRAGQVLARISPEDFRARVAELDAQLQQAQLEVTRLERLQGANLATEQALEGARTKVSVYRAQRSLGARQLRDTQIVAPFDGSISLRHVSRGAYVRAGTALFDLVGVGETVVSLDVPERYATAMREGTAVRISQEDVPSAASQGTIVRVAPALTVATRTLRVEAQVDSASNMKPGMFVVATIDLGAATNAVRVPQSAVFTTLGESRVVVVENGLTKPTRVEHIGDQEGFAVLEGLAPGSVVVTRNPGVLAEGTRVRKADAPATALPAAAGDPT